LIVLCTTAVVPVGTARADDVPADFARLSMGTLRSEIEAHYGAHSTTLTYNEPAEWNISLNSDGRVESDLDFILPGAKTIPPESHRADVIALLGSPARECDTYILPKGTYLLCFRNDKLISKEFRPPVPAPIHVQRFTCRDRPMVFFDRHGVSFSAQALKTLEFISAECRPSPGQVVLISGSADDDPTDSENMALSKQRADAVQDYLIAKGFDPTSIWLQALGDTKLVVPRSGTGSDGQNRSVTVYTAKGE
jgi:outer membrane protein OmpA-like peptidoglycan-associated protein